MAEFNKPRDWAANDPKTTYIGEGVSIKGEISVPDVIVVDGTVEGELTARTIRIGASGSIKGNIVSTDADVHGTLSEKAEVKQLLTVRASGRIEGSVTYGELEVEKGGVISGAFSSTEFRSDKKQMRSDQSMPKADRLKVMRGPEQQEQPSIPVVDLKATN